MISGLNVGINLMEERSGRKMCIRDRIRADMTAIPVPALTKFCTLD